MSDDVEQPLPDVEPPVIALGDDDIERPFAASLLQEVESGNTKRALSAIRKRIAEELWAAEGKDVAQLSLALVKVLDAIDKVPDLHQADPVNEIAARRERRRRDAGLDQAAGQ